IRVVGGAVDGRGALVVGAHVAAARAGRGARAWGGCRIVCRPAKLPARHVRAAAAGRADATRTAGGVGGVVTGLAGGATVVPRARAVERGGRAVVADLSVG